jgi:hypothetical protein
MFNPGFSLLALLAWSTVSCLEVEAKLLRRPVLVGQTREFGF